MKKKQVSKPTSGVVRATANTNRVQSPSFVTLYTNDVSIITTPWDVCLHLGAIQGPEGECVRVQQLGELRMSPQFAKKLTQILISQLREYEEALGPIPQPQD